MCTAQLFIIQILPVSNFLKKKTHTHKDTGAYLQEMIYFSSFLHYFLGPNPVLNLVADPKSTSSLEVRWSYPQGAQANYTYFVSAPQFNTTVSTNSAELHNLEPGTCYNITVKTVVAPQSESTEEKTRACTSKT